MVSPEIGVPLAVLARRDSPRLLRQPLIQVRMKE